MRIVSVVTQGHLAAARVLAAGLREHEPDSTLEVLLIGEPRAPSEAEPFAVTPLHRELGLALEQLPLHLAEEDLLALCAAHVLLSRARRGGPPTIHMPPSTAIYGDLAPLWSALERHGVLLVERTFGGLPDDDLEPTSQQLEQRGRIMPSLLGADASPRAQTFLGWWCERLDAALGTLDGDPPRVRPEDRPWTMRYLELAPALFSTAVIADEGCAVSEWNLHERGLARDADGALTTATGAPVRFIDFTGFDPTKPFRLSPHASRARPSRVPELAGICRGYADALRSHGWATDAVAPAIGDRLANGLVIDQSMQRLFRIATELGTDLGDVRSDAGTRRFMDWLLEPAAAGGAYGINRYVHSRIARERADVVRAYPELDGEDGPAFVQWCWAFGRSELGLPDELLPPRTPPVQAAEPAGIGEPNLDAVAVPPPDGLCVRVSGYLGHALGLGAAARAYAEAMHAAGLAVSTYTLALDHLPRASNVAGDYGRHHFEDVEVNAAPAFELVCVNADELPGFMGQVGTEAMPGWRIGVWGWETDAIPQRWASAFELVNEIWVYSDFVRDNLARLAPVPVVCLPPPVVAPAEPVIPTRVGVPEGFLFLFVFDYLSTIQRKNPVGLIEAFKRAFAAGEGPQLLIKTINAPLRPLAEEEVLWAGEGRPDIHVIDRSMTSAERDGLLAGCDCYVSLHRSEGFGLTMAEAMAIGKPVIGTGYSGNLTFMTPDNSYLVDHTLTLVGADCEIYPPEGHWAEPSVEHAAELMRRVVSRPDEARALARRARSDIERALSPQATGRLIRDHLEGLARVIRGTTATDPSPALPAEAPSGSNKPPRVSI